MHHSDIKIGDLYKWNGENRSENSRYWFIFTISEGKCMILNENSDRYLDYLSNNFTDSRWEKSDLIKFLKNK